ncbi:hypothetical protein EV121DRAFT_256041 [Schizophyllum commune]
MAASGGWPAFQDSYLFRLSRVSHKFYCTLCFPPGQGKARHMTAPEALEHERTDVNHRKRLEGRPVTPPPPPTVSPHALTADHLKGLGSYCSPTAFCYADDVNYQVAFWNRSSAGAQRGEILRWEDFFSSLDARREKAMSWEDPPEYEDVDDYGVIVGPTLPGAEVRKVKRHLVEWGSSGSEAEWAQPAQPAENNWGDDEAQGWGVTPDWEGAGQNGWDECRKAAWQEERRKELEENEVVENLWADYDPEAADTARREKRGGFSGKWGKDQEKARARAEKKGKGQRQNKQQPQKGTPQESKRTRPDKAVPAEKGSKKVPPKPRWFTEEVEA